MEDKKLAEFKDERRNLRFGQKESETYDCVMDSSVPEWQRSFSHYCWYGKIPVAAWAEVIDVSLPTASKILYGKHVELPEEKMQTINRATRAIAHLINTGALPCTDRKAVLGIFKIGMEVVTWQDYYTSQQQQHGAENASQ